MNSLFEDYTLKKIFLLLLGVIFIVMVIYTPDYGINGDDVSQYNYGKSVWSFLSTFGNDRTAVTGRYLENTQTLYGGFFEGISAMLINFFHPKDVFLFRHYWVMLFGFLGVVITGLLAKEIGGWRTGILAIVFLFFTARYFGESFNNSKDIPFAVTYILAVYAIILWLKNIETLKWKPTILMGLAIALCISMRIGGLLLFGYLGLFYLVTLWQKKLYKGNLLKSSLLHLAVAVVLAYFVSILWWPYALESPISGPLKALKVMSNFPLSIYTLFEGHKIDTVLLPLHYLPKWLLIGLPLYLLLGFIGGTISVIDISKKINSTYLWMIIFVTLFPVLYILYKNSVLYDGFRHVMFLIPPMAVTAAIFFIYVFDGISNKGFKYAFAGITLVLIILPARFMFANHPNEYVYFNEIAGGIKNSYGNYETDYYMNSINQGYKWLLKNELSKVPSKDTIVIATNCIEPLMEYQKISPIPFKPLYCRFYEKNQANWDYALYYSRFLDKEQLENGYFPSSMAIHIINADGVPLCAILKNDPQRNGFKGYRAMQRQDTAHAITWFNQAVAKYHEDMEVWDYLAILYMSINDTAAAQNAINKAMAVSTLDIRTAFLAGDMALQLNNFKNADKIYRSMIKEYPKMGEAYLQLGKAQAGLGNYDLAIDKIKQGINIDRSIALQSYMVLAYIYKTEGDTATARQYFNASKDGPR